MEKLSTKVVKETGHPLVFIIDELDRCRPTFAIELLERIKHIFEVSGLVFVFGINRDELCKSLDSVYGRIDADTYLRRFFDIEFVLSDAGTETFCSHVFEKFGLDEVFVTLSRDANSRLPMEEFRYIHTYISKLWSRLGLSLRDIENCVRLVALVGRNLHPRRTMYPELIGVLLPLKFANASLYGDFVRGDCTGSKVMDYIYTKLSVGELEDALSHLLETIEVTLYRSDARFSSDHYGPSPSVEQLSLLNGNENLTAPHYLTEKTQSSDKARISRLCQSREVRQSRSITSDTIAYLAELIDLHQDTLRR